MCNVVKYSLLLASVVLLFSCQKSDSNSSTSSNDKIGNVGGFCLQEKELLCAPDSLPQINIDFNKPPDSIFAEIEFAMEYNICDKMISFGLPYDLQLQKSQVTSNSINLPVIVYKQCDRYLDAYPPKMPILMNNKEEMLINGKLGNKDSLEIWIEAYYYDYHIPMIQSPKNAFFNFRWDERANKDSVTAVFASIIKGYMNVANRNSQEQYNKLLCELPEDKLDSLKHALPFNLKLSMGEITPDIPLPPPPEKYKDTEIDHR